MTGKKTRDAIFVTGALGFIGSYVAVRLAKKNKVIGFDRIDPSQIRPESPLYPRLLALRQAGVDLLQGQLEAFAAIPSTSELEPTHRKERPIGGGRGLSPELALVEAALQSCKAVVHTAAPVKERGPLTNFRRVNVDATIQLATLAAEAGVKRWVQLSSVMVYGFHYPRDVTEVGPLRGDGNSYCITKIESEHALLGINGWKGMDVVILRPGDVYGPESEPWVVRPLRMMKKKQFVLLDGGIYCINHVHVEHVARAIILALECKGGQIFNVTDGNASSCREYFGALATMAGYKIPPSIPSSIARIAGGMMEIGYGVIGKDPQLNREAMKFVMRPYPVSSEKARSILGLKTDITLQEGMKEIRQWLEKQRPDLLAEG